MVFAWGHGILLLGSSAVVHQVSASCCSRELIPKGRLTQGRHTIHAFSPKSAIGRAAHMAKSGVRAAAPSRMQSSRDGSSPARRLLGRQCSEAFGESRRLPC